MKRAIHGLCCTLLWALIALPATAQDPSPEPWYEVEIILFEHLDPAAMDSEHWPATVARPDLSDTIELLRQAPEGTGDNPQNKQAQDTAKPATPYLILPPEQYRLKPAYEKLATSDAYLPLLHLAWRQVIPPRDTPDRILIHDALDEPLAATTDATAPQAQTAPGNTVERRSAADIFADDMLSQTESPALEPPAHTLSGVLALGLGRYLHVKSDLLLYKPLPDSPEATDALPPVFELPSLAAEVSAGDETGAESDVTAAPTMPPELFRIQGDLRLRSGEVHYLDHPLVGMLILFTPYTPPQPPPAEPEPREGTGQPFVSPNQSEALPSPR